MKYYLGKLKAITGEYENEVTIKFMTLDHEKPDLELDAIAADYYCDAESEGDYWVANCGDVATCAQDFQEITEEVYNILTLITELQG